MTTGRPVFSAVDDETADLLSLVADVDDPLPVRRSDVEVFLDACEADAEAHGGLVSVNRVRARVLDSGHEIPPRRYSSLWAAFGRARPMRRATTDDTSNPWEVCDGSPAGNDGRPFPLRVWTGYLDPAHDPRTHFRPIS